MHTIMNDTKMIDYIINVLLTKISFFSTELYYYARTSIQL